jgi:hypothetical protein
MDKEKNNELINQAEQVVKTSGLEMTSPVGISPQVPAPQITSVDTQADLYTSIFSSFIITRTTLVLVGEADIFNAATPWHFIVILYPLLISNDILQTRSRRPKLPEFLTSMNTVFHTVLLFGLGWTIPSCFASLNNTIGNYFVFTAIIRFYQLFSDFLYHFQTRNSMSFVYQSLFQTLSVIVWLIAMWMQDPKVGYIVYSIGVFIDLGSHLFRHQFEIAFLERQKSTIMMIFALSNYYFFEKRILGTRFELDLSVNFDFSHFIYAILAICMNYVMFQLYSNSIIGVESCGKKVLLKLIGFLTLGSYLFFIGSLEITLAKIYSPLRYMANYPIDLSIPINLNTQGVGTTGIEYLSTLGSGFDLQGSKMYIFAMLISLGVFGISVSITSLIISHFNNQKRDIVFLLFVPLVSVISIAGILIPPTWAEQKLNVVFIVMTIIFILVFPSKYLNE